MSGEWFTGLRRLQMHSVLHPETMTDTIAVLMGSTLQRLVF